MRRQTKRAQRRLLSRPLRRLVEFRPTRRGGGLRRLGSETAEHLHDDGGVRHGFRDVGVALLREDLLEDGRLHRARRHHHLHDELQRVDEGNLAVAEAVVGRGVGHRALSGASAARFPSAALAP